MKQFAFHFGARVYLWHEYQSAAFSIFFFYFLFKTLGMNDRVDLLHSLSPFFSVLVLIFKLFFFGALP